MNVEIGNALEITVNRDDRRAHVPSGSSNKNIQRVDEIATVGQRGPDDSGFFRSIGIKRSNIDVREFLPDVRDTVSLLRAQRSCE